MNKKIFKLASLSLLPYFSTGIRGEYIILSLLFLPVFFYSLFNTDKNFFLNNLFKISGLFFSLLTLVFSSVISPQSGTDANSFTMFARVLMPVIMFFTFIVLLKNINDVLYKTTLVISLFGALAGVVTVVSAFLDLTDFLSLWVSNSDSESVWAQANGLGRFTGLFNQPLEAGVFFFVSTLSTIVALYYSNNRNRIYLLICISFSILGGLLSLSKNYSIIGLPLLIFFSLRINLINLKSTFIISTVSFLFISNYLYFFNSLYLESFIMLYNDFGILNALSAGRYGSNESSVANLFNDVLNNNLFFGFGLGSKIPLDSGYLEYFYQGGLSALIGYIFFLASLLYFSIKTNFKLASNLLSILFLYITLASFGGPVITANRANILLFILISAVLIAKESKKSLRSI